MDPITTDDLRAVAPKTNHLRLEAFLGPLNTTMEEFDIDTPGRQAAFLAQLGHESNGFLWVREIWGPTPAQRAYEPPSRKAAVLGNLYEGDGFRYRGRGLIQITGRGNYAACGQALNVPLEDEPELLEEPALATRSAGWFWSVGAGLRLSQAAKDYGVPVGVNLNDLADLGEFKAITYAINGGLNGEDDRIARWEAAKEELA